MLVSEAMNRKLVTVEPDAPIEAAAALSRRTGAEHLLVVDESNLVGILCECDLRDALPGDHVCDRMTVPVLTVRPDTPLEEVATTLSECHVGCVPVTLGGLILGTASHEDLERCGILAAHGHRHCHGHAPGGGRAPPH
jgi:acetoin utilization protein AcuB